MSMPEGIDLVWVTAHQRTLRAERLRQALQDKRERGQVTPSGQRWATNHASAFSSVLNISATALSVRPLR